MKHTISIDKNTKFGKSFVGLFDDISELQSRQQYPDSDVCYAIRMLQGAIARQLDDSESLEPVLPTEDKHA